MCTSRHAHRLFLLTLLCGLAACDRPASEGTNAAAARPAPDGVEARGAEQPERVILVTGSTGTQGGAVARELIDRGYAVRGLTRSPDSDAARDLAELGATMVRGDYDDPASLAAAMEGVHGVFAVTLFWHSDYQTEVEQGRRLIDQAEKSGVGHFVLTSVAGADRDTGIPHFDSKWEVEQHLHASQLDWTIVRPVEFMDNWGWSLDAFREGRLIDPRAPESSHQWIAARDIGFFVGEAFDDPETWVGQTREIAGDELTIAELRVTLSETFGRDIEHIRPGWAEFEAQAGEEIALMYRWFEDEGYGVDVDALRQHYPDLQTAAGFLSDMARTAGH